MFRIWDASLVALLTVLHNIQALPNPRKHRQASFEFPGQHLRQVRHEQDNQLACTGADFGQSWRSECQAALRAHSCSFSAVVEGVHKFSLFL